MSASKGFRVRFHLGAGVNFMEWQVRDLQTGQVSFYDPNTIRIRMDGCKLRNNKKTAQKIHDGQNKTVCAWVDCEWVSCFPMADYVTSQNSNPDAIRYIQDDTKRVSFNPRVNPSWIDQDGVVVDGKEYPSLVTAGRKIFFPVY